MKAKVIMYAKYGDTVVSKYVDIEKIAENVYTRIVDKHERHKEWDTLQLIYCVKGVYFRRMEISREKLDRWCSTHLKELEDDALTWVDGVRNRIQENRFVSNVEIRAFKELGLDVDWLVEAKNNYEEKIRAIHQAEREEILRAEQERERAAIEAHNEELKMAKQSFINGERIETGYFMELCKNASFLIHPRTAHLMKQTAYVKNDGTIWAPKLKSSLEKCHQVVRNFAKEIK